MIDEQLTARVRKHVRCDYATEWGGGSLFVHGMDNITFEIMAAISEEFGTRLIDVDCNTGTGSDPCHDRTLIIRGRTR